jgi:hypothetical protein
MFYYERKDFDAVTDIRDELIEKAKVTKLKNQVNAEKQYFMLIIVIYF